VDRAVGLWICCVWPDAPKSPETLQGLISPKRELALLQFSRQQLVHGQGFQTAFQSVQATRNRVKGGSYSAALDASWPWALVDGLVVPYGIHPMLTRAS